MRVGYDRLAHPVPLGPLGLDHQGASVFTRSVCSDTVSSILYFQNIPTTEPDVRGRDVVGKAVMILRWAEDPRLRMLMYGLVGSPIQVRKMHLPMGRPGWEVNIQVANAWQALSPRDEVFIYDSNLLDSSERSELMNALSKMLTGESASERTEIDLAIGSILSTYRDATPL
jgi:hypothetical protein